MDEHTIAKYRCMTPAEKIQLMSDLNQAARERAATRLNRENPGWNDAQVLAEVARLMLNRNEEYFE